MESTNHHVGVERESMPVQPYEAKVPIYSDDLLLDLQRTLAVLADIETK